MLRRAILPFILFVQLISVSAYAAEAYGLSCEFLSNPLGIDNDRPSLGWKVENSVEEDSQTFYRILVSSSLDKLNEDVGDLWDSGKVRSSQQVNVRYDGKDMKSGQFVWWKVRIWTRKKGIQTWSNPASFSVGLLDSADWKGQYISLDSGEGKAVDSPIFWKRFEVKKKGTRYLLHLNSLGYHELYLNGKKVGDAVLQPVVSQLNERSLICTYDVSDYMDSGENDLVIWISEGWNRAFAGNRNCDYPAVRAQLQEISAEGQPSDILFTDDSWLGRESGYSVSGNWKPFNFGGDIVDAGVLLKDFSEASLQSAVWQKTKVPDVKAHIASPQMVEPDRYVDNIHPVSVKQLPDGAWLLDFGTCMTAMLEFNLPSLSKGTRVEFDYADCLDKENSFPVVRRGDFKDIYVASGNGGEKFVNRFSYHGFRYVRVSGLGKDFSAGDVVARSIHTDYGRGASFDCSDKDLAAIHDMVKYTVNCLTACGYMVDCPHIERLGYGGDGNASTPTLQTMFNVAPLVYNWTSAWADAQREDGGMPHTAPAPYGAGGGPFWCGFLIVASWESYLQYGDTRPITAFYPQMKRWIEFAEKHFRDGLLQKWSDDPIRKGWFLGDWAAPEYVNVTDSSTVSLVSNCFMAHCYDLMSRIASVNQDGANSEYYARRSEETKSAIRKRFYAEGSYATGSQLDLCYPMLVGAALEEDMRVVRETLKRNTSQLYRGSLSAGLVGIPVITRWATQAGEADFMYGMLKKRTYPGYLYMIDNGATTTWEYWNGYRSHIHNCYNGVGSWFYEALGGIVPDETQPGYRHFFIKPQVPCGLEYVKVSKDSPYGEIRSEWEHADDMFTLSVTVPFGASATVVLPDGSKAVKVGNGCHKFRVKLPVCCASGANVLLQDFIDTRVGTDANSLNKDGRFGNGTEVLGQTLPAVTEPNGMNCWTPQTRDTEKKGVAPYYYRDSLLQGFRNSHWIVGGCTQDYGSMTVFPATSIENVLPAQRATAFSHTDEKAAPSYYSVYLKGSGIFAEMTARSRSAIFRFTYPEGEPSYLIVNPNSDEGQGYIEIDTLRHEIRGYNPIHRIYQGWGKPTGHSGFFVIRYYDEIDGFGTYCNGKLNEGCTVIGNEKNIGAYISFKNTGKPVTVKASSSFTDAEGAGRNLDAEIPHADFDRTRAELCSIWETHLSKVEAISTDTVLCRKFYGAMYRASFLPRTINDVDGRYPKFSYGAPVLKSDCNHYDDFSMWDTYRALHPLIVLLDPHKDGEMMQSLVDKYSQGGWLPIFPCWNSYTAAMIGDHCIAAIGDAIVKGVDNFDIGTAYEAMRKNAFESPEDYKEYADGMGRRALKSYLEYGYIPLEDQVREAFHSREQTSRTLEYAYDDFVLSQVAKKLGRMDDYDRLKRRSLNYRNVIDPSSGYANGRYADGRFFENNDVDHYAGYVTEGAPCHYTWYVPHDPYGLMSVMGGRERYLEKLDRLFEEKLYWHGNEPCHQVAYMYDYAGQAWKTQKYVRNILDTEYGDLPGGLAGNDDSGQMSAWFIFSSLGFYPVCPGNPEYMIGSPQFDRAVLHLDGGRSFTILTVKTGKDNRYIQSATLNGYPYFKSSLNHSDIVNGGVMVFKMGDTPNESWGTIKRNGSYDQGK